MKGAMSTNDLFLYEVSNLIWICAVNETPQLHKTSEV